MIETIRGGRVTLHNLEILVDGQVIAVARDLATAEALAICLQDGCFCWHDMTPERRAKAWQVFGPHDRPLPWGEFNYANWDASADALPPLTATPGEPEA